MGVNVLPVIANIRRAVSGLGQTTLTWNRAILAVFRMQKLYELGSFRPWGCTHIQHLRGGGGGVGAKKLPPEGGGGGGSMVN